jgi:hypothetical protein
MKKIFTILSLLAAFSLNAQVSQQWLMRYNSQGEDTDAAYNVAVNALGDVYVTGTSRPETGNGIFYTLIKYNSAGQQQWVRPFDGVGGDTHEYYLALDPAGNIYTTAGMGLSSALTTIKYNALGDTLWKRSYTGPGNGADNSNGIIVDASSNVYIAGYTYGTGTKRDFTTIKYDVNGVQQWIRTYNRSDSTEDYAVSIDVDAAGNVFVTGYSGYGSSSNDIVTIKYNAAGVQQWVKIYSMPNLDQGRIIKADGLGGAYVAGTTFSISTGTDIILLKYNVLGDTLWKRNYTSPGNRVEIPRSMKTDTGGNIIITGESDHSSATGYDILTIKYTPAGDTLWTRRYNGLANSHDYCSKLDVDNAGNIYIAGSTRDAGFNSNFTLIKYSSAGVQEWVHKYDGPGNNFDNALDIRVSGNGGFIYATGQSLGTGSSNNYDFATIKLSQPVGITPLSSEIPDKYELSQNYPNPFNPTTDFGFRIADFGFVSLKIYNPQGKEVAVLVNEPLKAGTYKYTWDASELNSGVYFYRLTAGDFAEIKKAILIK